MTVSQLVHQLSQYPPDSIVLMTDPRGGLRAIERTRQGKASLNMHIGVFEGNTTNSIATAWPPPKQKWCRA